MKELGDSLMNDFKSLFFYIDYFNNRMANHSLILFADNPSKRLCLHMD